MSPRLSVSGFVRRPIAISAEQSGLFNGPIAMAVEHRDVVTEPRKRKSRHAGQQERLAHEGKHRRHSAHSTQILERLNADGEQLAVLPDGPVSHLSASK